MSNRYEDDCGTHTYSAQAGHVIDITVMRGGGIRTECSCGFYIDTLSNIMSVAIEHAKTHRRMSRPPSSSRGLSLFFPARV